MSLREYRNRKKAKPSSTATTSITARTARTAATTVDVNSTVIINHDIFTSTSTITSLQSALLADADSLLIPRTVSLSTGFVTGSGKESTSTTASVPSPTPTALAQQYSIDTAINGQIFEPVSPSEDFTSNDTIKEKGESQT